VVVPLPERRHVPPPRPALHDFACLSLRWVAAGGGCGCGGEWRTAGVWTRVFIARIEASAQGGTTHAWQVEATPEKEEERKHWQCQRAS
jgi:hypothetical protein